MDFVKNYFVCKDERAASKEALAWLTTAHLPHQFIEKTGELFVFNINKYYIHFFVEQFRLENWYFRPTSEYMSREVTAIMEDADKRIAQNSYAYHSYSRRDPDEAPFFLPSVFEEITVKAFNGTGYQNWKTRYYLTRGMLSEEFADFLVQDAAHDFSVFLQKAGEYSNTDTSTLKLHIYFDDKTFFCGWFENSDEYLTIVSGAKRLAPLNKEMTEAIKRCGLERNIHSSCGIDGYLDMLNIELPRHFMDYDLPEDRDIRNFAIVPIHPKKDYLKWIDATVYGIDRPINSHLLINQQHNIHRFIDDFDRMCFCSVIPEGDDEYAQFFTNLQAQIDYNKSLPYWKALPFCQLKFDKKYDHLKGLDARASEYREPVTDTPHRYIIVTNQLKNLTEAIARNILGEEYEAVRQNIYFEVKVYTVEGSPIVQFFTIKFRKANNAELKNETRERIKQWLRERNFLGGGRYGYSLMGDTEAFIKYMHENIPETQEYIKFV